MPTRVRYGAQVRFASRKLRSGNGMDRLLPHPASLRGLASGNRRSSNELIVARVIIKPDNTAIRGRPLGPVDPAILKGELLRRVIAS
jgi:hypothetical protein